MISDFLSELNESNSSNYKISTLKKYQNSEIVKQLLKLTYDKNNFNFGMSRTRLLGILNESNFPEGIDKIDDYLDLLQENSGKLSGNSAKEFYSLLLQKLTEDSRVILLNILGRDLKCGINIKNINKVFKNLIPKPNYMRCAVFSEKLVKKIHFPAMLQLKMDGTYREFNVSNGTVSAKTRAGEEYFNPVLFDILKSFPDGYYMGELTIDGESRFTGNGLINSLNPPLDKIIFTCWDFLTFDEYTGKVKTSYIDRFNRLQNLIESRDFKQVKLVENHIVNNVSEALKQVSLWMSEGLEGGVLKDFNNTFKNGTSNTQLKIKLKVDAEMRITGFTEGTPGTKREGKIGAIQFANDEGTIKGQCSGFSDAELEEFSKNKDSLIGKIISVEFNDITKAENNEYYALSHPRFIEIRNDKNETDDLKKVIQLRDMAKML